MVIETNISSFALSFFVLSGFIYGKHVENTPK